MESDNQEGFSRQGAKAPSSESFTMEKLYVNEIRPDGEISTVGLFYSRVEAENIVAQLRAIPDRADCRYEIIEAVRHVLLERESRRPPAASKEKRS